MKIFLRRLWRCGLLVFALLAAGWNGLPALAAAPDGDVGVGTTRLASRPPVLEPPEGASGVNLVPIARNFYTEQADFARGSHDVVDGCITPGAHRLLRFDFLAHNAGDKDLVMGSPLARPELFTWSNGHNHYHLKNFNDYRLFDRTGRQVTQGYKQTFCLFDSRRLSPWSRLFIQFPGEDCDTMQGISAGWADFYSSDLDCQYVDVTGLPDGEYALLATVNADKVVREIDYDDNTICVGVKLEEGRRVRVVEHPVCQGRTDDVKESPWSDE